MSLITRSRLAQSVERGPNKLEVTGSNPVVRNSFNDLLK